MTRVNEPVDNLYISCRSIEQLSGSQTQIIYFYDTGWVWRDDYDDDSSTLHITIVPLSQRRKDYVYIALIIIVIIR